MFYISILNMTLFRIKKVRWLVFNQIYSRLRVWKKCNVHAISILREI